MIEFFRNPLLKLEKLLLFLGHFQLSMKVGLSEQLNCRVVFAAALSMPCVHIRDPKLYGVQNSALTFHQVE